MTAVYDAWCGLVAEHSALIERVAARYGLTAERLLQSSLLCVALHDVGKLSRNFQRMMRAPDQAAYKKAVLRNYRHEVASLWLVSAAAAALAKQFGPIPGDRHLEVLAVAGHHKYLADGYLFDQEKFQQPLSWEPDAWGAVQASYALAVAMFRNQGWALPGLNERMRPHVESKLCHQTGGANFPFDFLISTRDELANLTSTPKGRFRDLFILLKGLLMTADWMASGAQGHDERLEASRSVVRVDPEALEDYLRERVEQRRQDRPKLNLPAFGGYRPFQTACGAAEGHVLAIAPTGSGKTEAALLWALGQVQRGHARKIFFLLPTMVTANSIHDRLREFFTKTHGHDVGLVHSTSDLVKREGEGREDESDRADVRANDLSISHFFPPVTVGTVDQLLMPLFHAGRWAMKTLAAADAAIVIDEVHAYEPHTAGLIVLMMKQLRNLGASFLVMSATMPTDLRNTIRAALEPHSGPDSPNSSNIRTIEDRVLLDSARNDWSICETPLTEWLLSWDARGKLVASQAFLDLWRNHNDRGEPLKILIVVNTVKRCQELAQALRRCKPVCYHSKFIFRDRRIKEDLINRDPPRLLIATQVVEVSLDIDYDILLTECAPIDALVQRAGRVNRARRAALGRVIVHPPEDGSQHVYGEPAGILDASWELCRSTPGPLTEDQLIRMVEQAYSERVLKHVEEFRSIQARTLDLQERLRGILDAPHPEENDVLKTRLGDYQQVSVIPDRFHFRVLKLEPRARRLFELKMPAWYARIYKVKDNNPDDLPICRMNYGPVYGGRFLTPGDRVDTGSTIA